MHREPSDRRVQLALEGGGGAIGDVWPHAQPPLDRFAPRPGRRRVQAPTPYAVLASFFTGPYEAAKLGKPARCAEARDDGQTAFNVCSGVDLVRRRLG